MDSGTLITIIVVVVVIIALGLVLLLRRNRTRKPNSHRATGPRQKTEGDARVRQADAADPGARYGRHDIRATEQTTGHATEQPGGVIPDRDDGVDEAEPQQT